jgi:hypothetical protein
MDDKNKCNIKNDPVLHDTIIKAQKAGHIPTAKLENKLLQPEDAKATKIILIATGAYSPIHIMHIHMLEAAKTHLEQVHKGKYDVVAGFVSPSHDNYVSWKLRDDWIPIEHRYKHTLPGH